MKLCIEERTEDVEQMVVPMVRERGENLKITVYPCPIVENETCRFYVEVETKKNEEKED